MTKYNHVFISIILLSATFLTCVSVQAQEETEGAAEVNAFIEGDIPSIKVTDWTPINITIEDAFGINWDYLKEVIKPNWRMYLFWPLVPAFPQPVQRFLGYTSVRLEPEIVEGDPRGWFVKITPNTLSETTQGIIHNVTLEAKTDDAAVDYSVVVGIKCTRIDTMGGEIGSSYIYIPVKASALNLVKMKAVETTKTTGLKSMVYFDVDILNKGYYKDVFQFILEEEGGLMALPTEQALVLDTGEIKRVTIGVLTPEKFIDWGTPNKINVYVTSAGDPSKVQIGSLVVITEGIYISPLVYIISAPIIIVLLIIFIIFFYRRGKRDRELFGKPQKPWTIPDEKKHLEELKRKNKEEYDKERQMMEDEYKSAILWFKNYRDAERQRGKKEISESKQGGISRKIFKKKEKEEKPDKKTIDEKKQKIETGNKITQFLKKPKKKNNKNKLTKAILLPKKQKPKKPVKKKKVKESKDVNKIQVQDMKKISEEQRRKEKLLLQIKRDQDKQKRMIK